MNEHLTEMRKTKKYIALLKTIEEKETLNQKWWGKHVWAFLDYLALTLDLDDEDKLIATEKVVQEYLPFLLSCAECGDHCYDYLLDNPVNLESREGFLERVLDFNNSVNERIGKPITTRDEYIDRLTLLVK